MHLLYSWLFLYNLCGYYCCINQERTEGANKRGKQIMNEPVRELMFIMASLVHLQIHVYDKIHMITVVNEMLPNTWVLQHLYFN